MYRKDGKVLSTNVFNYYIQKVSQYVSEWESQWGQFLYYNIRLKMDNFIILLFFMTNHYEEQLYLA